MLNMVRYKREFNRWQRRYDAGAPKVGDTAPDFELSDSGGENPVRLSDYRGKRPVALIFGSFT
jgi:peroxiredoxin